MRYIASKALAVAVFAVGGCAIHPLPEDIQKYSTAEIVKHIRCEARTAIEKNAIALLLQDRTTPEQKDLGRRLEADETLFARLTVKEIPGADAKAFYLKYINSGIAYNYTFDISEENNNSTELDFGRMLTNNSVSLKLTAKADLTRDANRQFVVSDKFGDLLRSKVCADGSPAANLLYPIAGEIGLKETIKTFIALNEEDILKMSKDDSGEEVLYSDHLKFTTIYGGTVNPGVMINPMSNFRLTQAMATSEHTRTDMNQVIIGISLGTEKDAKSSKQAKRQAARGVPLGLGIISQNVPVGAEARAIDATVQNRVNRFLDSLGRLRTQ